MTAQGQCKSCHALIVWARFAKSGKRVPLDVGAHADGNLDVVRYAADGPLVRVVPIAERGDRALLRAHFASCPFADSHRVRK